MKSFGKASAILPILLVTGCASPQIAYEAPTQTASGTPKYPAAYVEFERRQNHALPERLVGISSYLAEIEYDLSSGKFSAPSEASYRSLQGIQKDLSIERSFLDRLGSEKDHNSYFTAMASAIVERWNKLLIDHTDNQLGGKVTISCILNPDGVFTDTKAIEGGYEDGVLPMSCMQAIGEAKWLGSRQFGARRFESSLFHLSWELGKLSKRVTLVFDFDTRTLSMVGVPSCGIPDDEVERLRTNILECQIKLIPFLMRQMAFAAIKTVDEKLGLGRRTMQSLREDLRRLQGELLKIDGQKESASNLLDVLESIQKQGNAIKEHLLLLRPVNSQLAQSCTLPPMPYEAITGLSE